MKACRTCKVSKAISEYHLNPGMVDGHRNDCKECKNKFAATHYKKTIGVAVELRGLKRRRNGEGLDPIKASLMGIRRNHKRKALELNANPGWRSDFDTFVLNEAAELCVLRRATTGFKWSIDHTIPLMHKEACGLHWHKNFEVVPHVWNCIKRNHNFDRFQKLQ